MHFCSTVRKTRIVLVRTISLMIVFSVSSGFVRFLLFNFQRAPPSRDSFYILPRHQLPVNTFFSIFFQICFFQCCHLADDLIYIISFPLFCQLFFPFFFTFFSLFAFLCTSCYFPPFCSCFPTIKKPAQQRPLLTGKPFHILY